MLISSKNDAADLNFVHQKKRNYYLANYKNYQMIIVIDLRLLQCLPNKRPCIVTMATRTKYIFWNVMTKLSDDIIM